MSYFYFQVDGEVDQLILDTNAIEMNLPGISRNYEKIELFNNTAYITGSGNFKSSELTFTARYRKGTYNTAWNDLRYAITRWIGITKRKALYFYIVDSNGDTFRTRVYPQSYGTESYRTINISNDISFSFFMKDGYYEKVTASSTTTTLTGTTVETLNVTNNGLLPVPPLIEFTPSATATQLQVTTNEGYGFKIEGSWSSGTIIQYDCKTSNVYINGNITAGLQTAGSVFTLEPGTSTLYIYAQAGDFEVSINERYI